MRNTTSKTSLLILGYEKIRNIYRGCVLFSKVVICRDADKAQLGIISPQWLVDVRNTTQLLNSMSMQEAAEIYAKNYQIGDKSSDKPAPSSTVLPATPVPEVKTTDDFMCPSCHLLNLPTRPLQVHPSDGKCAAKTPVPTIDIAAATSGSLPITPLPCKWIADSALSKVHIYDLEEGGVCCMPSKNWKFRFFYRNTSCPSAITAAPAMAAVLNLPIDTYKHGNSEFIGPYLFNLTSYSVIWQGEVCKYKPTIYYKWINDRFSTRSLLLLSHKEEDLPPNGPMLMKISHAAIWTADDDTKMVITEPGCFELETQL